MLGANRTTELATSLMHLGGLSGTATQLHKGDLYGALITTIVACCCVIMLSGALFVARAIRLKMREYVRKHDEREEKPMSEEKDPND